MVEYCISAAWDSIGDPVYHPYLNPSWCTSVADLLADYPRGIQLVEQPIE